MTTTATPETQINHFAPTGTATPETNDSYVIGASYDDKPSYGFGSFNRFAVPKPRTNILSADWIGYGQIKQGEQLTRVAIIAKVGNNYSIGWINLDGSARRSGINKMRDEFASITLDADTQE